jgi:hypothetical protein
MHSVRTRIFEQIRAYGCLMMLLALRILPVVERVLLIWKPRSVPFRFMTCGESLPTAATPVPDNAVVRYWQQGPYWDASAVNQTIRHTDASLLFWQEQGQAQISAEGMLALFQDERTFAVSRQSHFRGWKSLLFPTAPFRALQRNEATQVLAPLAPSILVDRRKLLALGVPDSSLAGTAWMILFWKAAAAGWRSYCVGCSDGVSEQPDMPMQEAGFRLHRLFHPALRRLGPRQPDLSRGNVAFALPPRSHTPQSDRLKVLLVSPFLPYPLSHGGAVRIFNLCRELCDRVDFSLWQVVSSATSCITTGSARSSGKSMSSIETNILPVITASRRKFANMN